MTATLDASPTSLAGGQIQSLGPGTYISSVDGFACGVVNGGVSADGTVFCWISGSCGPISMVATGGQLSYPPDGYNNAGTVGAVAVGNSFTLPVPAETPFTLAVNQSPNNATDPVVSLSWVPMG